jgi:hypothetical protein
MREYLIRMGRWIQEDWNSWPLRFVIECLAWCGSIGAALWFALSVPNVPFVPYLCVTIASCALYSWAAWTRKSFGMLANYLLLTTIDSIGFLRLLFF